MDLKKSWTDILAKSKEDCIFSTWEWLSGWWRHFGKGRKLRILLIHANNKIRAIAPLMLSKYRFLHFGTLTKIEFIGSPQSDYNNFILTGREMECFKLFWNYLSEHNDWNYIELSDIPESAVSVELLRKMSSRELLGGLLEEKATFVCPFMNLPDSTEIFMSRLSGNMRRNLRRRMRRLNEKYLVKVKTHSDFDSIEEAMDTFYKLHQKRWKTQGKHGVFAEKALREFHNEVARLFSEKKWLSLYIMTVDDVPIGAIYSFDYKAKKYEYLTGFDPEYSKYGVANLLRMHAVDDCIRKGLNEYDLMRGDEPYKASWRTKNRRNLELRFIRKGLFPKIYGWATKSAPAMLLTQKLGRSLTLKR